jgi:hypothetical protein
MRARSGGPVVAEELVRARRAAVCAAAPILDPQVRDDAGGRPHRDRAKAPADHPPRDRRE